MTQSDDQLTRLTVNLTPRATSAMNAAAEMMGDTKTGTVNRALMLYAQIVDAGIASYGARTVHRHWPDWDANQTLRISVRSMRRWWQLW